MSKPTCSIADCGKPVVAWGWCDTHYRRWKKHGDPLHVRDRRAGRPSVCIVEGCTAAIPQPGAARGWCRQHYLHWKRHGDPLASAFCAGCGIPIRVTKHAIYCMRNPECRRLAKALQYEKDPERTKANSIRWKRANPEKTRASVARYKARTDRICVRPDCKEFALPPSACCRQHTRERSRRRYARIRLLVPMRLYKRQGGMCPDADHGGCGLPLGTVDGNHVDHVIPEVRNGPDEDWNLQLMHRACNLRKSDALVPAAVILVEQYGVTLVRPDGTRPRKNVA